MAPSIQDVKNIVVISDGSGKTAKRLMDAVLAQYSQAKGRFLLKQIYKQVRDKKTLDAIFKVIDEEYLIIFSIISQSLSRYCHEELEKRGILHTNVLEPMLSTMSKFLGVHPDYQPGILQIIDDRYYKKVDAIGYTVEHDDGCGQHVEEADIVLVGLSRTCKTPISMYLACNYGMKAANIPIITDERVVVNLLTRLAAVPSDRVVGLTMRAEVLAHVREERSIHLGARIASKTDLKQYCDVDVIRQELKFCQRLFTKHCWPTFNVTRRAIEEVAAEIVDHIGWQR